MAMQYNAQWTQGKLSTENKQLIVAIDHGLSFPDMPGLERPFDILNAITDTGNVNGIIAAPGIYRQAEALGIDVSKITRLITVDFVAMDEKGLSHREIVIEPAEAAAFKPDCYKMFFNIYPDKSDLIRNIKDLSRFAAYGRTHGISCLAEVLFHGNPDFDYPGKQAKVLFDGCRMAMEIGADTLKIPMIADGDAMGEIIDRLQMPTFILGGAKHNTQADLLQEVARIAKMPVCGLMFGRNVWQSADMRQTIGDLAKAMKTGVA